MLSVSIVISSFNYGTFLRSSIDSALSQTYQPCEVIVVDDGSTDGSQAILKDYAGRVQIFELAHTGETASRNFGFSKSSGDLVCFLDADDFLDSDCAARVVNSWNRGFTKLQYHMRIVDRHGVDQRLLMPRCRLDSGFVYPALLRSGRYITAPGSGNFYARSFLEKILPAPVDQWPQSFDSYAATYAGFLGEVAAIQEPLANYRVHNDNMSRAVNSDALEIGQIDILLGRQLRLRHLIQQIASARGLHAHPGIVTSHWLYLKLELAKRMNELDPPLSQTLSIIGKMTASALTAPELTIARRLQLIGWALGSAFLPHKLARQVMKMGFDLAPEGRWTRVMRRL